MRLYICINVFSQILSKIYKRKKHFIFYFAFLFLVLKFINLDKNHNLIIAQMYSSKTTKNKNYSSIFNISEEKMIKIYGRLENGGRKKTFSFNQHVAIIVPFRDRPLQLSIFLRHMHFFLSKQPINYGIFIVEQISNQTFNRGKLMNVGFLEALKNGPWNCFFFHDVDLIPENKLNYYKCRRRPTHFTAAIDILNYSVPYYSNFGGVTAMFRHDFEKLNGFSNEFWGWGYEDDELRKRLLATGSKFYRLPKNVGRYTMISHKRDKGNPEAPKSCRIEYLNNVGSRFLTDGLNTIKYTVQKVQKRRLYTQILVDLLAKRRSNSFNNSECLF